MANQYVIAKEGMSALEKAMIGAGQFSQIPTIETWDGINSTAQILAPGIDDLTLMASRHPWASAWYLKEDAANSIIATVPYNTLYFGLRTSAVIGEAAQVVCCRSYGVGQVGWNIFGENDERLIFEHIVKPEENDSTAMDWFVGFAANSGDAYLTDPELVTQTLKKRWGFAIDNSRNIYGISADGAAAEVTANHDLVDNGITIYLKAVYKIGDEINFYVNETLIGTLSTNIPIELNNTFLFHIYAQATEANDKRLRNYATRLRYQNGE